MGITDIQEGLWGDNLNLEYFCDERRHLVCKPYSLLNLHRMAYELDIGIHWFHKDHYDIPKRRIAEITAKCTMISTPVLVRIIRYN